jgi:hypothetical protein
VVGPLRDIFLHAKHKANMGQQHSGANVYSRQHWPML